VQNDAAATKQIMAAKDEMKSLFEGESKWMNNAQSLGLLIV
jgi:hypothetical protein